MPWKTSPIKAARCDRRSKISGLVRQSRCRTPSGSASQIESVASVLGRLLLDAQDTGVISDTAVALLARRDVAGLHVLWRLVQGI